MKIYLNDDTNGISIENYNHNYQLDVDHFTETYVINIAPTENVNTIASTYEGVLITTFAIKTDDGTLIKEANNLSLKITQLNETVTNDTLFLTFGLST